jgi:hypothetical protein
MYVKTEKEAFRRSMVGVTPKTLEHLGKNEVAHDHDGR